MLTMEEIKGTGHVVTNVLFCLVINKDEIWHRCLYISSCQPPQLAERESVIKNVRVTKRWYKQ